jgi:hypothetical protein
LRESVGIALLQSLQEMEEIVWNAWAVPLQQVWNVNQRREMR